MHWTNGIAAEAGGAFWQFTKRPFSPYQFISADTVTSNDQALSLNRPLSGIFARRILYFNSGVYRVNESYGHEFGQTVSFQDSMVFRTDGGDYNQAVIAELRIKPRGTGRQVARTGHGTNGNLSRQEGVSALVANFYMDGDGTNKLVLNGTGVAFTPYLVMFSGTSDTINNFVYVQPNSFVGGGARIRKAFAFAPASGAIFNVATVDSAFLLFDTARVTHSYVAGKMLIGFGDSTVTQARLRVNGSSLFNGWSGYWANVAADYTVRSFTDKNYVDSLKAVTIAGNVATATALQTGRTISVSTDATGTSASFDGTGNVTIPVTLATVNSNVGSFGSATQAGTFTVNGKGLITAASNITVTPAVGSVTGLGTNVATALAVNVGTAGAFVTNGGALGTPSSGVGDNLTTNTEAVTTSNTQLASTEFVMQNSYSWDHIINTIGTSNRGETVWKNYQVTTTSTMVDNIARYFAIWIPVATTLTGVRWWQATSGNYTADQENSISLYTYSGGTLTEVATTGNVAALWSGTANTLGQQAFTSTYAASAGLHFIAFLYNNSAQVTAPTVGSSGTMTNAGLISIGLSNSAKLVGTISGQNTLPSSQALSGVTNFTQTWWGAVY
jgi:hypothetical protein